MGAWGEGMAIHQRVFEKDFTPNIMTMSTQIAEYAKCRRTHNSENFASKAR